MAVATAPMFDPELDRPVAEEVVGGLAARIGGKNWHWLVTKRVPLLGGGIGAVMDGIATHQVGKYAKGELLRSPRPACLSPPLELAAIHFLLAPASCSLGHPTDEDHEAPLGGATRRSRSSTARTSILLG